MLAITMARNEADIIRATVTHLIAQGCRVVVADNLSSDGTVEELLDLPAVTLVRDEDPAYRQADKMTGLCERFAEIDEWVIPFDADEYWNGLDGLTDDFDVSAAQTHVHIGERRVEASEKFPKVAFRWKPGCRLAMGNHSVYGTAGHTQHGVLTVCHYQYRTLEQVRRKVSQGVAAYDLTDIGKTEGAHWRHLAAMNDTELEAWWTEYVNQPTIECKAS